MTNQTQSDSNIPTEDSGCFFVSEDIKPEDIKLPLTDTDINQMSFSNCAENECNVINIKDVPLADYFKPFEKGWKRELVIRSVSHGKTKAYDVYYISPCGKRLRSRKDIEPFLTDSKLSIDDFSFHKELVGIGNPDLEIFRHAQARKILPVSKKNLEEKNNKKKKELLNNSSKKRKCDLNINPVLITDRNNLRLLKKNQPNHSNIAENQDEINRITLSAMEMSQNSSSEIITITSSGRKGRRPKHLQDYKVNEIYHRTSKSKNHTKRDVNNGLAFASSTFRLNYDEPSTSSSNGGNLYVDVVKEHFDISSLQNLNYLRKIEISSSLQTSFFVSELTPLSALTSLASLKLTSVKDLNLLNIEILANLSNLEYLCLGYCDNFPNSFAAEILICLKKLRTLRLEGGQDVCALNILDAVSQMPSLQQLELLNFNIPAEFGKAMTACRNIKKLLLIPIYEFKAHLIMHWILKALFDWQQLEYFVFIITESLIKMTKEFNAMHGLNIDDSVPILESTPTQYVNKVSSRTVKSKSPLRRSFTPTPLRVEFITVSRLQFLFSKILIDAQVKIVSVPDSEIWKTHL
ncbi:hypothetical protein ILUMI_25467 [Ignelater luminosus]|uniref:MBD domain-containing protein n=1 Tax=Ignelater luminosus TaxID=2038154 RepID=A0A8K0FXW5_IGNLU|nr:hypothetical protein ILUMI_25467 [Ignelater luminosus]